VSRKPLIIEVLLKYVIYFITDI